MNSQSKSQMLDKFVPYYPTKDTRNFPIFSSIINNFNDLSVCFNFKTANAIININRYKEIVRIADQQIKGIARIAGAAGHLRAALAAGTVWPLPKDVDWYSPQAEAVLARADEVIE